MDDRMHTDVAASAPPAGATTIPRPSLLQGFAEASPDLVAVTDRLGRIVAVNPAWGPMLGLSSEQLVGRRFLDLIHPDDVARTVAALRQVLAGEPLLDFTNRWQAADGSWRWVTWSVSLAADGRHGYASGRDLTSRIEHHLRSAEEDGARQHREQELERELREERDRTGELELVERRKDTLLSAVSHDLRTPLGLIENMVRTLHDLRDSLDPEEVSQLEEAVVDNCERLNRLVDELLDVDRMRRGQLAVSREPVDLRAVVDGVVATGAARERVEVSGPPNLVVAADPVQVERIVANLLDNAAKYAPDGTIRVTLEEQDGRVRIAVRDEGPGIPTSALEQVFEPYRRLEDTRGQPGTGVGLSLVAEFAQFHGGRAWAEPSPRGAHVVVELPVDEPG